MATTKADEKREEIAHARRALVRILGTGTGAEIGTLTVHGSGLTDWVECFTVSDGSIVRVSYWVSLVIGRKLTDKGIPVRGGGFSKAHDVVDDLSRALYGAGDRLRVNRLVG